MEEAARRPKSQGAPAAQEVAEARCPLDWRRTDLVSRAVGHKGVYLVVAMRGGGWRVTVDDHPLGDFKDREAAERQAERHEAEEKPRTPIRSMPPPAQEPDGYAKNTRDPAEVERGRELGVATSPRAVYDMLSPELATESQEVFLVLPVDLRGQPLSRPVEIARGQVDRVHVGPSDVMAAVQKSQCKGFIVIHCHPSGHATPSPADRKLTEQIEVSAKKGAPDVLFLDHVVIARSATRGEYYSFAEGKVHP